MTLAATKAKKKPRRGGVKKMPRPLLDKMLTQLANRLEDQVLIAESIAKAAAPTGKTLVAAYPMAKVIEMAAVVHARELREAWDFVRLIAPTPREVRSWD